MPTCVAVGCTNRTSKRIPGLSFHKFPKNVELRKAWMLTIMRQDWEPSDYSVVCSEHFEESDFDRYYRIYLKENAVPSVFKNYPLYMQEVIKKIKMEMQTEGPSTVISEIHTSETEDQSPCSSASPIKYEMRTKLKKTEKVLIKYFGKSHKVHYGFIQSMEDQSPPISCSSASPIKYEIPRKLKNTEKVVIKYRRGKVHYGLIQSTIDKNSQ